MKSRKLLCAVFAVFVLSLTSCIRKNSSDGKIKMCVLVRSLGTPFMRELVAHLRSYAEEADVELAVYDGNDDVAIQTDQLKTQLTYGTKYFIILPVTSGCTEQYSRILDSKGGYAVFTNQAPTIEALKLSSHFYVSMSLEISAGDFQAEILADYFKKYPERAPGKIVKILYFDGQYGHKAQVNRRIGFMEGMAKRGYTVDVLAEDSANWSDVQAREMMFRWFSRYSGQFNAVVSENDAMALGAIDALLKRNYTDDPDNPSKDVDGDGTVLKIPIIGVDNTKGAKVSMQAHQLYATVLQDSAGQAGTAFELMYECARKGTAEGYTTKAGITGAKEISKEYPLTDASILSQCYIVPFKPVTK